MTPDDKLINGETHPYTTYSKMQRFREGIHIRTMKAKRKVEEISKEDVQAFLKKNAFVLFTVGAVVLGRLVFLTSNNTNLNKSSPCYDPSLSMFNNSFHNVNESPTLLCFP
jgi:hypothetical protein